jgi:hypothetical protein
VNGAKGELLDAGRAQRICTCAGPVWVNYYGTFRDKVIRESAFRKTRTVFEVFRQLIEELRTNSSQSVPLWTLVGKRMSVRALSRVRFSRFVAWLTVYFRTRQTVLPNRALHPTEVVGTVNRLELGPGGIHYGITPREGVSWQWAVNARLYTTLRNLLQADRGRREHKRGSNCTVVEFGAGTQFPASQSPPMRLQSSSATGRPWPIVGHTFRDVSGNG